READNGYQREIQREDSRDAIVQKVTYKNMLSLEKSQKLLGLEI
ncbi:MurR/RpiR family transcriptional regulator, partial [Klebsiella oxytoca]